MTNNTLKTLSEMMNRLQGKLNPEPMEKPGFPIHAENTEFDVVSKPKHYNSYDMEVIDAIKGVSTREEFEGACKANIIKYVTRFKFKDGLKDLKKARAYLNMLIELQEGD